jgi:hypothetical protein
MIHIIKILFKVLVTLIAGTIGTGLYLLALLMWDKRFLNMADSMYEYIWDYKK